MRIACALIAVLILAGCRLPDSAPSPVSSPGALEPPPIPPIPPPPVRHQLTADVAGVVVDGRGSPVSLASVMLWPADAGCIARADPVVLQTGARGEFEAEVIFGVGPEIDACLVIEARAGGSVVRQTSPARYSSAPRHPDRVVHVELHLPPAPLPDEAEARRIVELLVRAIQTMDRAAIEEVGRYVGGFPADLRPMIDDYRSILRGVSDVTLEETVMEGDRAYTWRLTGESGRASTVVVYHDRHLTWLRGPLLQYGARGRAFLRRFFELLEADDPMSMARLLTADDIDYPVEGARAVISRWRSRFEPSTLTARLVEVDEQRSILRYRVNGLTPDGRRGEEIVELGFGDGLLWLRGA